MKRIISQLVFCIPLLLVGIALVLATAQIFWGIILILLSVVLFFILKNVTDENLDRIIKGTILVFVILLAIVTFKQNIVLGSIFLIIPVIYGFSKLYANVSQRQEDLFFNNLTEQEKQLKNMNFVSNREIDILGTKVFKVDEKSKQIAICDLYSNNIDIIKFDEIVDVELLENDSVIMKGGVGRAIVGDIVAGGVGAIVGATTRKSQSLMRIELRILLNNISNSVYSIKFGEYKIGSYENINARKSANEIYGIIKAILNNRVDNNLSNKNENTDISKLKELAELKEKGIITEEEFKESKKKILNKL